MMISIKNKSVEVVTDSGKTFIFKLKDKDQEVSIQNLPFLDLIHVLHSNSEDNRNNRRNLLEEKIEQLNKNLINEIDFTCFYSKIESGDINISIKKLTDFVMEKLEECKS